MNVAGINKESLSFGKVSRLAKKMAIKDSNGDRASLRAIKQLVREQKDNNVMDVTLGKSPYFPYLVFNSSLNAYSSFNTFKQACDYATKCKDKYSELVVPQEGKTFIKSFRL